MMNPFLWNYRTVVPHEHYMPTNVIKALHPDHKHLCLRTQWWEWLSSRWPLCLHQGTQLHKNKVSFSNTSQDKNYIWCNQCRIQKNQHMVSFTFLADSRFSEWLGKSSSVRLCCLSKPGMRSVLVSASTVESLCTDDSSGKQKRKLSTLNASLGFHDIQNPSFHIQGECWPEFSVKDGTTKAISVRASA